MTTAPNLYESYIAFKGWDAAEPPGRPEDFQALLNLTGRGLPKRLLDIGCGRGLFLDWAKSQGILTSGVEIIPDLIAQAEARGHQMIDPAGYAGAFDVITAIDVLEHLRLDQLREMLATAARLLTPDGVFIARFPNGASPFFGAYQHGDLTHTMALTPNALRQVAEGAALRIVGIHNPRSIPPGLRGLKRRAVHAVRDLIEIVIGYAYFGKRMPMDPNVAVLLSRITE
jgi:SAM-dependent methyltransferase